MNNLKKVFITIAVISVVLIPFIKGAPIDIDDKSSCKCVCGVRGRSNRIIGGKEAIPYDYPWLVAITRQRKLYCGATLISNSHLVTAAHCVDSLQPKDLRVLLGGHNVTKDFSEDRLIRRITVHKNFNMSNFDNDIAILEMSKPVKFGPTIQPACLPDNLTTDLSGSLGVIAGWGRTIENKPTTTNLQYTKVPIWSRQQCLESLYGKTRITTNMFCAGYHDGQKDACQGDSGGGLVKEGPTGSTELIGIVSWGRGCARPNLPGIYTQVVNYLPWIKKILNNSCLCSQKGEKLF